MALRVSDHRNLVCAILEDHGLSADDLELVPDVQAWCVANNIPENNPHRQAKFLRRVSDGKAHVVMVDVLTDDMIASGKGIMEILGFTSEVAGLDTDLKYLAHLTLHEVACHVLQTPEQAPRDEWAFRKVAQYAI